MPMPLSAIPSFEKRNRCSINVHQMENSKLVSVYHSKNRKVRHKIDLLRQRDNQNSHYCFIKNLPNLIHFLTRSRKKHDKGPKSRFCRNCFQPIKKRTSRNTFRFAKVTHHLRCDCLLSHQQLISSIGRTQKCPFVVFADLEAIYVASAQFP